MRGGISLYIVLLLMAAFVHGCGGGGGSTPTSSPTPTPTPTPVPVRVRPQITLRWGERSRAIGGLSSALSALVTLKNARPGGGDVTLQIDRDERLLDYNLPYTLPEVVEQGQYELIVTFHAARGMNGEVVGEASGRVAVNAGGILPDVALTGKIVRIEVPAQEVLVGTAADIQFTPKNAQGAIIAVSPGSAFFQFTQNSGQARLVSGRIEGIRPGATTLTARVDGIVSDAATVRIVSEAEVTITPATALVGPGQTIPFTASVSRTTDQSVAWLVVSADGGTLLNTGLYTAPTAPGTYRVRAISVYDPEKFAEATIEVQPGSVSVGAEFPATGGVGVTVE